MVFTMLLVVSTYTPTINAEFTEERNKTNDLELSSYEIFNEEQMNLLNSIFNQQISYDLLTEIINFFEITKSQLFQSKNIMLDKARIIHEEIREIIKNGGTYQEFSPDLKEFLNFFEKYDIKQTIQTEKPSISSKETDWEDYLEFYQKATTIWSGHYTYQPGPGNRWYFLDIFNSIHSESNYYDWSTKLINKIDFIYKVSIIVGILCIPALSIVPFENGMILINLIAGVALSFMLWFDYNLASYAQNGNEFMQELQDREINILLHVVEYDKQTKTYKGVNGLYKNHGIEAINYDAKNWSEKEPDPTTGRSESFFTYYLGPTDCKNDENGWYSLKKHYLVDGNTNPLTRYKKAPCPPGSWKLTIHGNSGYKTVELPPMEISAGDTIILDNVTIEKN